jgi:hypothetical protein
MLETVGPCLPSARHVTVDFSVMLLWSSNCEVLILSSD